MTSATRSIEMSAFGAFGESNSLMDSAKKSLIGAFGAVGEDTTISFQLLGVRSKTTYINVICHVLRKVLIIVGSCCQ